MSRFLAAHATHPEPGMALALAAAQIEAQRAALPALGPAGQAAAGQDGAAQTAGFTPTLGLVYITDHYAAQAEALLADLQQRWPGVHWAGTVGVGVAASGVEYIDEPALTLMLGELPTADFQVFSGRAPLNPALAFSALVHADPGTPDLAELVSELADRTASGYLFGGLAAARTRRVHFADGVFEGGLSGVGFAQQVALVSRVSQGCQPIGPSRRITATQNNLVLSLDDQPALPLLLADLGLTLDQPQQAMAALRATLVGLTDPQHDALARGGQFGADTRVRNLVGIDPVRRGVAVADAVTVGQQLAFCRRDVDAARRDLVRICAELRDELDGDALSGQPARRITGAIYVSCAGRGGPHFGAPSAELQVLQHALGEVPLVGFFAGGEIARHHLYGYTGVLTLFTAAA